MKKNPYAHIPSRFKGGPRLFRVAARQPIAAEQRAYCKQGYALLVMRVGNVELAQKPYLTTSGLATCVGLTLYSARGSGAIAHFDSDNEANAHLIVQYLTNHLLINGCPVIAASITYTTNLRSTLTIVEKLKLGLGANVLLAERANAHNDVFLDLRTGAVGDYDEAVEGIADANPEARGSIIRQTYHAAFSLFALSFPVRYAG